MRPTACKAQSNGASYSFLERNLTHYWMFSFFSELGYTPALTYTDYFGDAQYQAKLYFKFVGAGYEAKLNLYSNSEDFSVSVNAPVKLDLNTWDEIMLLPSIGTYMMFNFKNGATYNNLDKNGFGIGIGFKFGYYNLIMDHQDVDRPLLATPTIKLDVVNNSDYGTNRNSGFSLYVGIPSKYTNVLGETQMQNGHFGLEFRRNIN